jgi:hypothetical protein
MAMARRATKLTMMVTGGDDDNDDDGATGYDDNGNDTMATARRATKSMMNRCEWK